VASVLPTSTFDAGSAKEVEIGAVNVTLKQLVLGRNVRVTVLRAALLIVAALLLFGYVLIPVRLHGISMLPTYRDGAINFANRLAYVGRHPVRGDAVAIRMAGPSVLYVKRIVGLPGERVQIARGIVLVNGEPLKEPAVRYRAAWNLPLFTVGPDEYFVIGDNRAMQIEDHDLGRARRDRVVGKMLFDGS
jgi:signal peptidase I